MPRTAAQIRQEFIEFFRDRHAHAFAPSSPVVPHEDPTLLFTNAGMNQFKDVFLGRGDRPYTRAVNSQKCIRAGGKHNDLEDVGADTYHHTFFEMLGNWSFGDYFKAEAIEWAWTLLTEVWGLDPERMYVTVFEGSDADGVGADTEAETLWRRHVPAERISRWGRKDNFWEMGETGPCGPCSEIHYDCTPDGTGGALVNQDDPNVIEVWNLVFIQFNRDDSGALTPLPAKHVDTGMGLERVVRVIQGKTSNYDTDLWTGIFEAISAHTGAHPYGGSMTDHVDIAYRVIADHARCLTAAIADGARPSSEGRGYVLRRILRRAVRHAHQTLGVEGPLLCDLVPAVVASLGEAFPEFAERAERCAAVIREEEESFLRTLDRGIALFDEAAQRATEAKRTVIEADDAFRLHDTYGFPIDLTRVMAQERGLDVDEAGYERLMEEARERSRQSGGAERDESMPPDALAKLQYLGVKPTMDLDKYHGRPIGTTVKALWNGRDFDDSARVGEHVSLIVDRTNFYAEAGGQVGDQGRLVNDAVDPSGTTIRGIAVADYRGETRVRIIDTKEVGGYVLHVGRVVDGTLRVGDEVSLIVNHDRRVPTMANHTSTHLLNHALRTVLGDEVEQRGSLVAPDRLRFDFSHAHAMTDEEIADVEARVRTAIAADHRVDAKLVPLEQAKAINGVRAIFGERYPDPVRVVSIGASVDDLLREPEAERWRVCSIEFCGGTHLTNTNTAEAFVILSEQGLAAGVRRITAVTGVPARAALTAAAELEARLDELPALDDDDFVEALDEVAQQLEALTLGATDRARLQAQLAPLQGRGKKLRKAAKGEARAGVVDQARSIAEGASAESLIVEVVDGADKETLLSAMDVIRDRCPGAATMLFSPDEVEGKVAIAATVPKELIGRGLRAGDWVREAARACGGGGGGRPDMAQAGGKDPSKVEEAIAVARSFAKEALS